MATAAVPYRSPTRVEEDEGETPAFLAFRTAVFKERFYSALRWYAGSAMLEEHIITAFWLRMDQSAFQTPVFQNIGSFGFLRTTEFSAIGRDYYCAVGIGAQYYSFAIDKVARISADQRLAIDRDFHDFELKKIAELYQNGMECLNRYLASVLLFANLTLPDARPGPCHELDNPLSVIGLDQLRDQCDVHSRECVVLRSTRLGRYTSFVRTQASLMYGKNYLEPRLQNRARAAQLAVERH
jgi:hypothetical protein